MRGSRRLAAVGLGTVMAGWIVGGTAQAADSTVRIESFTFMPGSVTVNVGDTVTWRNDDTAGHTATAAGESRWIAVIGPSFIHKPKSRNAWGMTSNVNSVVTAVCSFAESAFFPVDLSMTICSG